MRGTYFIPEDSCNNVRAIQRIIYNFNNSLELNCKTLYTILKCICCSIIRNNNGMCNIKRGNIYFF